MVPNSWEVVSLGDCLSILKSGLSRKLSSDDIGIPVIRSGNMSDSETDFSDLKYWYLDDPQGADTTSYFLDEGDLLINFINSQSQIGKTCIFKNKINRPCIYTTNILRAKPNERIEGSYLYYITKVKGYFNYIQSITKPAVNQASFTTFEFKKYEFLLPPIPEQKKIAQILSTWDKAITTTEQLLANSRQQKKALMQRLLTGKQRLLNKDGVRFSGEWKEIRLKSVLREEKARNKDNSIDRVLSVTNHSGFVLPEEQFSKRVASDNVSNYKLVRKGQYGYNPSRLNVGSFARLDKYDEGLLSPMYVVFSVKEKLLDSDYFLNWMSSNEAKQRISGSTQGSVRDSVGFDALCCFPFKLPPLAEQQKIAAVLSNADREIDTLQHKLDILKQEKKALMQQLLTGKRRVMIK